MKKILTLFQRDKNWRVVDDVRPECRWVLTDECFASQKLDGTCCIMLYGNLYRRHKQRLDTVTPQGFLPIEPADEDAGTQRGWLPVIRTDNHNRWHLEAWDWAVEHHSPLLNDHTYELVGPKILANPERYVAHRLVMHGSKILFDVPTDFDGLRDYLNGRDIEGVVWKHEDGRYAKIRQKDFGLQRGKRSE